MELARSGLLDPLDPSLSARHRSNAGTTLDGERQSGFTVRAEDAQATLGKDDVLRERKQALEHRTLRHFAVQYGGDMVRTRRLQRGCGAFRPANVDQHGAGRRDFVERQPVRGRLQRLTAKADDEPLAMRVDQNGGARGAHAGQAPQMRNIDVLRAQLRLDRIGGGVRAGRTPECDPFAQARDRHRGIGRHATA